MGEWTKAAHVSLRSVLDVLDGDIGVLPDAFVFSETPQGFDFWQHQMDAQELNSTGREELEHLLLQAEERLCSGIPDPAATMKEVREAIEAIRVGKFDTYPARNGREVGVVADDGEKCWIIHSDDIARLEALLAKLGGA